MGSCPSRAATMNVRPFAQPGIVIRVESFGTSRSCAARECSRRQDDEDGQQVFHGHQCTPGRCLLLRLPEPFATIGRFSLAA